MTKPNWLMVAVTLFAVSVTAQAKTTATFKSKIPGTIKICIYKTKDAIQAIPMWKTTLHRGQTVHWSKAPAKYHVKVFKPQALDKLIASRNNVPYNATVTITSEEVEAIDKSKRTSEEKTAALGALKLTDHSISITWKNKRSLVLRNDTGHTVKFAVYKPKDKALLIPWKKWTVKNGKTVTWKEAPDGFHVKVFRKGRIADKLLATKKRVPDRKTVRAYKSGKKYRVSVK